MAKISILPALYIRQLLRSDDCSGKLYWKPRPRAMFDGDRIFRSWNSKHADVAAFTSLNSKGYHHGKILGDPYLAHRVIWAIVYGRWPEAELDHIDGDPRNNAISNLREVDRSQNMRNTAIASNNTSGVKGVCWNKWKKLWSAQITLRGKTTYLGAFSSIAEAEAAYKAASLLLHGEFSSVASRPVR